MSPATQMLMLAGFFAIAVVLWFMRGSKVRIKPPTSIVLLRSEPRLISIDQLATILTEVVGRRIEPLSSAPASSNSAAEDIVTGAPPHFMALIGHTPFAIHTIPEPYMRDPQAASESAKDLRLRKAIREHKAWVSVDVLRVDTATADRYTTMARVAAALVDEYCVALYYPPKNRIVPCDAAEVVAGLRSDDPIRAVFDDVLLAPVTEAGEDSRLKAAEAEARRRFDEFEQAFRNNSGSDFAIKAEVQAAGNSEHIWIQVDSIADGIVKGRLANDPVELNGLKLGSEVRVHFDHVEDWMYMRGDKPVGLFTVDVLQQIAAEGKK